MHREHSIHDIHVYAYVHTCVRTMYTLTCIYAYVMPWMHTHTRTCHTLEMSCSYELLSVPCILCSCTQFILPIYRRYWHDMRFFLLPADVVLRGLPFLYLYIYRSPHISWLAICDATQATQETEMPTMRYASLCKQCVLMV